MEHRKIVDEREARALLAKARRSGADVGVVARSHGVDGRSLNAWKINLARGGLRAGRPREGRVPGRALARQLVELVPAVVNVPAPAIGARYTLRVAGVEVEFDDGFRADTLRRLLGALQSC